MNWDAVMQEAKLAYERMPGAYTARTITALNQLQKIYGSVRDDLIEARKEIETLKQVRDHAYRERNQLVAALSHFYPAGVKETKIEGWHPDWHGCVYIDLPSGQASWHFHKREADLFAHLSPYEGEWDGHGNEEKYERLQAWAKKEGIYD